MDRARLEIQSAGFRAYESFEELLEDRPDHVVEIAGGQALRQYGVRVLKQGLKLIAVSVGALADDALYEELKETARQNQTKGYLTSGAVGGFDVLQTIHMMGIARGPIENFKVPHSLNGAPYLKGRLLSEEHAELVYDGTAREAIQGFPQNVNVAIGSALASVGVDQMEVSIESRAGLEDNIHKIMVENDSVKAVVEGTDFALIAVGFPFSAFLPSSHSYKPSKLLPTGPGRRLVLGRSGFLPGG